MNRWARAAPYFRGAAWGLGAQTLASATGFCLTLVAARSIGAEGLGEVFIAFSLFLVALGFQRALLIEPFIAFTSTTHRQEDQAATRYAVATAVALGVAASLLVLAATFAVGGAFGAACIAVAPWLLPALLHDLNRAVLFRDGRGATAVALDAGWLLITILAATQASRLGTTQGVLACWGLGALVASAVGLHATGGLPGRWRGLSGWWRREIWPFARWLAIDGVIFHVSTAMMVIALAAILSIESLGGFRSIQSLAAPLTLLGPGLALSGLPAVSRALARGHRVALLTAAIFSCLSFALTAPYLAVLVIGGKRLVAAVFGADFARFSDLVVPMSVGQLFAAGGLGFLLLLKARQRGRAVVLCGSLQWLSSASLAIVFALVAGLEGAVWGLAVGSAIGTFATVVVALAVSPSLGNVTEERAPVPVQFGPESP